MAELFNGGEMDAFTPSDGSCTETTAAATFDSNFVRCALSFGGYGGTDTSYFESAHWTPATAGFLQFDAYHGLLGNAFLTATTMISLVNNSGTTVARLRVDNPNSGAMQLQYLNASAVWTTAGSVVISTGLAANTIEWDFSASGKLNYYVSGTERISFSGDLSHLAGVAYVRLHNHNGWPRYSQVMADTESTIGHRLTTVPVVSAGATSGWTGTYAEIDEIVYSDTDFINSATANQVSTFGVTGPTLTGYTVQSVTVSARAKRDASGPQNLQLALRVSGADYVSSSKALSIGYAPYQNIWTSNPASLGAWSNSAIAALQPGVKSIT